MAKSDKSSLKDTGISIQTHNIKRNVTGEDLTKDLVKKVMNEKITTDKINNGREFNN